LAIRIALGAQRWRVIFEVLKDRGRLACAGVDGHPRLHWCGGDNETESAIPQE
jgi:hypothetical protein